MYLILHKIGYMYTFSLSLVNNVEILDTQHKDLNFEIKCARIYI